MVQSSTKSVLVTRPNYDVVTRYFYHWSKSLIDIAQKNGHEVHDVCDKKVTEKEFAGRVRKLKPSIVVMNGHGNDREVAGQDHEIILNLKNSDILAGTITYVRACESGATLGPKCIKDGALAFVGYTQKFWLCYDQNMMHYPTKDSIAAYVLEPSNLLISSLIKGHTVEQAQAKSLEHAKKMKSKLLSSSAPDGATEILRCLWTNMTFQVSLGDTKASI